MNTIRKSIGIVLIASIPFLLGIGPPTGGDVKTISIANTTGVSGTSSGGPNPALTINLDPILQSLDGFSSVNSWPYLAAPNTWGKVSIGTGLSFTGGKLVNTYPTGHLSPTSDDTISSASTLPLNATTGPQVDVTGTTSITATDLIADDSRIVRFTGSLTLTQGSNLQLPGSTSITTQAGDWAVMVSDGTVTTITYFQRATGGYGTGTFDNVFINTFGKIKPTSGGNFSIGQSGSHVASSYIVFDSLGFLKMEKQNETGSVSFDLIDLTSDASYAFDNNGGGGHILTDVGPQTLSNKSIDASQLTGTIAAGRLPNPTSSTLGGIESYVSVTHQWINTISTSGVPASSQPAFSDISGSVAASQLPNPSASTLGGIESYAAVSHQWINTISTSGVPSSSQPDISDLKSLGTGVATALGNTINGTGGVLTTDGTATITGKTYDAAATGNTFKAKSYIYLSHPHLADGTNATIGTSPTSIAYGHATFSNSVASTSNYVEYYLQVPEDLDTSVALRARIKVLLGNTDTGSQRYIISSVSVADSAGPTAATLANAVNIDFAGDASGANGDVETSAWTTLTSWAGALTSGQTWRIRLGRDGNSGSDTSTVNSTELGLVIEYGLSQ